jgi:hypothetical protein
MVTPALRRPPRPAARRLPSIAALALLAGLGCEKLRPFVVLPDSGPDTPESDGGGLTAGGPADGPVEGPPVDGPALDGPAADARIVDAELECADGQKCGNACIARGAPCNMMCVAGFTFCAGQCVRNADVPAEICDDKDNNCNGQIDEGPALCAAGAPVGGTGTCQAGKCVHGCPLGQTNCSGVCGECCEAGDCPTRTGQRKTCTANRCQYTCEKQCCSSDDCPAGDSCEGGFCLVSVAGEWVTLGVSGIRVTQSGTSVMISPFLGRGPFAGTLTGTRLDVDFLDPTAPDCCSGTVSDNRRAIVWSNGTTWDKQ